MDGAPFGLLGDSIGALLVAAAARASRGEVTAERGGELPLSV